MQVYVYQQNVIDLTCCPDCGAWFLKLQDYERCEYCNTLYEETIISLFLETSNNG